MKKKLFNESELKLLPLNCNQFYDATIGVRNFVATDKGRIISSQHHQNESLEVVQRFYKQISRRLIISNE